MENRLAIVAVVLGTLGVAGCGSNDDYKNKLRPPSPINITAFVGAGRVSVSPNAFGAGPIVVVVTNQSNASQDVTFQDEAGASAGAKAHVAQSTGPINPGDTGQIKLNVVRGTYLVRTGDDGIQPARINVGAQRQSAQNQLLQP